MAVDRDVLERLIKEALSSCNPENSSDEINLQMRRAPTEVNREEENLQLSNDIVKELVDNDDDDDMDASFFLQLQELLFSDIHEQDAPQNEQTDENSFDSMPIEDKSLLDLIDNELTKFCCATEAEEYEAEQGDDESLRSPSKQDGNDINLQNIIAEELSIAIDRLLERDEQSDNKSVDQLHRPSTSSVAVDIKSDKNLQDIIAEELSLAMPFHFEDTQEDEERENESEIGQRHRPSTPSVPFDSQNDKNLHDIIDEELSLAMLFDFEDTQEDQESENKSEIGLPNRPSTSSTTVGSQNDKNLQDIIAEELSMLFHLEDSQGENKAATEQIEFSLPVDLTFDCPICMESIPLEESESFGCEHPYCKKCLIKFLSSKFEMNQVIDITCPTETCDATAEDKWIRSILPLNLIAMYDKVHFRIIGGQLEDIMYCPQCNESVECDLARATGFCPSCEHYFCTSCMKEFHGTDDCTDIQRRSEDINKSEQLINTQFKKCPKCQVNIEKDLGCYHMVCFNCKADFCWMCMELLSDVESHYRTVCVLFDYEFVKD